MLMKEKHCSSIEDFLKVLMLVFFPITLWTQSGIEKDHAGLTGNRQVQFPLKSESLIYDENDVKLARAKIARGGIAREIADDIVESAEKWISWRDQDLRNLIPDASVPRSFDLNPKGCPIHGDTIFRVGGHYPWILDVGKPFTVECPVGHETYPSNDFLATYLAGEHQKQASKLTYFDDGWGWKDGNGQVYWFVAYANQWMLLDHVQTGIRDLGRAYLLTGRDVFAHKALVFLHRLAEVYPAMDYEHQSRYGKLQKENGSRYPGKVLNRIWEAWFIRDVAESYDAVWSHIASDHKLQKELMKSGVDIQSFIETNLLEEALDAYYDKKIQGNYGMHQLAILYVLLARQYMNSDEIIDRLLNHAGKDYHHVGLRYALYNFVFRDGIPMESPGYNLLWIRMLTRLADRLKDYGVDLFENPRMSGVIKSPMALSIGNKLSIDVGDTGSTLGGILGKDRNTYETAFLNYKDTCYLAWIATDSLAEGNGHLRYESLYRPDLELTSLHEADLVFPSRLFPGYGLGVLTDDQNSSAVAMTYGLHGSHYHWDFLNFEFFAHGQKMMPDFGYPDAMNTYVSEIYTWSKNTVSHNTVVVDMHRQEENLPGILHDFSHGDFVQTIDASSPTYSAMEVYRRHMVRVHTDIGQSYVVDFFRAKGGSRHDYVLHGPPGFVDYKESEWSDVRTGTYAGGDVQLGEIYDHAEMSASDYTAGFSGYRGSGFQHLFNVQKLRKGDGIVTFEHTNDRNARLNLRVIQDDDTHLFIADAYDLPRAKNHVIKHLICQSSSIGAPLKNIFMGIIEPYTQLPFIQSVARLECRSESDWACAVGIQREDVLDIIISDTGHAIKQMAKYSISTDASTALITLDSFGDVVRVFFSDGSFLTVGDRNFHTDKITGVISQIDYDRGNIEVVLEDDLHPSALNNINDMLVFCKNDRYQTEQLVKNVVLMQKERRLRLNIKDDILVGRLNVSQSLDDKDQWKINNVLVFEDTYLGRSILNDQYQVLGVVKEIDDDHLLLADTSPVFSLAKGEKTDLWIANIGLNDQVELRSIFQWRRE